MAAGHSLFMSRALGNGSYNLKKEPLSSPRLLPGQPGPRDLLSASLQVFGGEEEQPSPSLSPRELPWARRESGWPQPRNQPALASPPHHLTSFVPWPLPLPASPTCAPGGAGGETCSHP